MGGCWSLPKTTITGLKETDFKSMTLFVSPLPFSFSTYIKFRLNFLRLLVIRNIYYNFFCINEKGNGLTKSVIDLKSVSLSPVIVVFGRLQHPPIFATNIKLPSHNMKQQHRSHQNQEPQKPMEYCHLKN